MKFLLTMNLPYTRSFGGANRSNRYLAEALVERGHTVSAVVPALASPSPITLEQYLKSLADDHIDVRPTNKSYTFTLNGVEVHAVADPLQLRSYLVHYIEQTNPDWILVSSEDPTQNLLSGALQSQPSRVVYLAHTPQMFPFGPASLYPGKARTELIAQAASRITISQFVSDYFRDWARLPTFINHPPHYGAGPFPHLGRFDSEYILLMNACAVKGISILVGLAERMPNEAFAALPGYGTTSDDIEQLGKLPNVTILRNQKNLDDIFSRTRALLMPSLWAEGFGMAVIDAMLRGIPVLGGDFGGVPEAMMGTDFILPVQPIEKYEERLGQNLLPVPIVPPQNIEPWAKALNTLTTNREVYEAHAETARLRAHNFVGSLTVGPFEDHLKELAVTAGRPKPVEPQPQASGANVSEVRLVESISKLSSEQLALLTLRLKKKKALAHRAEQSSIVPVARNKKLPLSYAQQRLWFFDQFDPGKSIYSRPTAVRLSGSLNVEALQRALNEIVRRHEALRTVFVAEDGRPVQVIKEFQPLKLEVEDLQHLPADEKQAALNHRLIQEDREPFDLAKGPLLRVKLLRLQTDQHVLLFTLHHIVSDGWSTGVMIQEVGALYAAYSQGLPSPLPDLEIQYADYAVWQRQWLQGEVLDQQLAYWRNQLAGASALALPTDKPRPPVQSFRGARHYLKLGQELTSRLKELSRSQGVTLYMVLLAGFQLLLHRYSGQTDISVGSPIAGRNRAELEPLIGFFVNTLVMRTDLSDDPSVRELLGRVREVSLGAYGHQEVPFEQLVDELQPERDLSRNPLFQVLFSLQNAPQPSSGFLSGLKMDVIEVETSIARFDLSLDLIERENQIGGQLEYNTDLFELNTITGMKQHWMRVLDWMAANPEQRLSRLPLLSEEERKTVLYDWNNTTVDYGPDRCLHEMVAMQARRRPNSIAVVCEGQSITYAELDRRANQLAHYLCELGAGPEEKIGVCIERSIDLIVALLGVLKSGGAYVPMDTTYPDQRLNLMAEDSGIRLLLTQQHLTGRFADRRLKMICLDSDRAAVSARSASVPQTRVSPYNSAYVIYTSGSTGRPKGVIVNHHSVLGLFNGASEGLHITENDVWTLFHSYSFDFSVWEIWGALTFGGTLVVVPYLVARTPEEFYELVCEKRVTIMSQTPSAFRQFINVDEATGSSRNLHLRAVIFGGEALEFQSLDGWIARRGDEFPHLINMYGITETTIHTTYKRVTGDDLMQSRGSIIGKPMANMQMYVLDAGLEPLPVGVAGELYLSGKGLARGYLGRPDLTAERFLPHPASREAGARLYRTGDLARYLPDGNIEYLGRLDHQVKVRGFRIELGEIESLLLEHEHVKEAVVLARGEKQDKRLVAYLVSRNGSKLEASQLREHLKQRLPDYMVPSGYVWLEQMPVTANGKLDRARLPQEGEPEEIGREQQYVAPRGPVEEVLAGVWSQVLGVERIGIHDNFFELGGDSILTIQIAAKANQAGLSIAPKDIFRHHTIAELSAAASRGRIHAEQGIVSGPVLLTPIQHWFFEHESTSPNYFNQAVLLETRKEIDSGFMEQAINALVLHHDSLRLRFIQNDNHWDQFIKAPAAASFLSSSDLSDLSTEDQAAALSEAISLAQTSLNISDGPVLRATLFHRGRQPDLLLIVLHHLVVDAVSWRILLEDLQTGYEQARRGEAIRFPAKTTSFKEWSERLNHYAHFEMPVQDELNYWTSRPWDDIRPIPAELHKGPNTLASAQSVSVSLTREETEVLLQETPRIYRTQINDLLLAALARAMKGWTGSNAILVDLEGHGREEIIPNVDLSRTVGWFTTIFPVLLQLPGEDAATSALESIKQQLRQIPNHGIGYGLLRFLRGDKAVSDTLDKLPSAEISFNYLGQFDQVLRESILFAPADESTGFSCDPNATRRYLLEVTGSISQGILKMSWTFSRNLHHPETVQQLAQAFMDELRRIILWSGAPASVEQMPTDYALARLDQKTLDTLVGDRANVEDIYPLSPMQEGMLFDTLLQAHPTVYCQHLTCELRGPLRVEVFKQAWQFLMDRHTALRTSFVWQNLARPLQIVHRNLDIPWQFHDLRDLPAESRQQRLKQLTDPDTMTQFDLSKPPLSSLSLIQTRDDLHHVVWTFHHIILDGWSLPILLKELLTIYSAFCRGEQSNLPGNRAYKDYIEWLQQQELSEAEAYWKKTLAGFTSPTVVKTTLSAAPPEYLETVVKLSPDVITRLHAVARKKRLTISTVLQGAWALVLSHFSGSSDVLYGVVTSGRPPQLAGIDRMVGMFINTLPLRVEIQPESSAVELLLAIQDQQVESRQYQYSPATRIQQWSQLPRGTQLFQYVLLFQNYPAGAVNEPLPDDLKLQDIRHIVRDDFPLVLSVGQQMILHLQYERYRIGTATAEAMLAGCERIFQEITDNPEISLRKLYDILKKIEKESKRTGLQKAEKSAIEKLRVRKLQVAANPNPVESHD